MAMRAEHAAAGFKTGAKKSPPHKLLYAMPFRIASPPVAEFAVVPPKLNMWGNSIYGDCVSAEEAYAKAAWSIQCGLDEVYATEEEVVAFARQYGYLDGATLTEVMDTMAAHGMVIGGKVYKDGPYSGVDYSNEDLLKAAICVGPVKIAIDAGALPSTAGNQHGWYDLAGGSYPNTDHNIAITGFGSAAFLYGKLGLPVPSALSPTQQGFLVFTWNTIGFVTYDWIQCTTAEAWVRTPTTPGENPAPPGPVALSLTATPASGMVPLAVLFSAGGDLTGAIIDYGDGVHSNELAGHTYTAAGPYTATLTNAKGEKATALISAGVAPPVPPVPADPGVVVIPEITMPPKTVSFYGPLGRVYSITIPGDPIPGGTYPVVPTPTPKHFHGGEKGAIDPQTILALIENLLALLAQLHLFGKAK